VIKLDEVIPVNGVVIHSQSGWPCSACRPSANDERANTFLCIKCAISLTAASIRRITAGVGMHTAALAPKEGELGEVEEGSDSLGWVPPALWEHR
jgi:hypothetical protein